LNSVYPYELNYYYNNYLEHFLKDSEVNVNLLNKGGNTALIIASKKLKYYFNRKYSKDAFRTS
jgi:hypothetical protein